VLLNDAEEVARRAGCRRLRLEVRADNDSAIHLYESRGYRQIALLPGYYEDGMSALRYERILDPVPVPG
jgi:ribosomal protein S18 acetylase RimI-like enzyme